MADGIVLPPYYLTDGKNLLTLRLLPLLAEREQRSDRENPGKAQ
jgi:hypothetical protein